LLIALLSAKCNGCHCQQLLLSFFLTVQGIKGKDFACNTKGFYQLLNFGYFTFFPVSIFEQASTMPR
jgi:hypothetical protein